ncbi:SSPO protein, partial [Podargus strigoides]|nr:SSPO protein [Podargus strigoides]
VTIWGRNISVNGMAVPEGRPYLHNGEGGTPPPAATSLGVPVPILTPVPAGITVTWPGDWVAVASGLGVRVGTDGHQAVTVTVSAELRGGTQGLCGPYNGDPADDFLQPGGDVAPFAASFANAWKIP